MKVKKIKSSQKRRLLIQTATLGLASQWVKPVVNLVVTPAHAQTSGPVSSLCADGTSTWLMSNYLENGTAFNQGTPQSQVEMTISGTTITLVTDWFVINSATNSVSRGRTSDQGTINLSTGTVTTNPLGNPTDSPTHGARDNLANALAQSFSLSCSDSGDFIVSDNSSIYSYSLSRVS